MAEQKNKLKIEDAILKHLDGDNKRLALGFVEYLRDNKINLAQGTNNGWKAASKGKALLWVYIGNNWCVSPRLYSIDKHDDSKVDDAMKELVWDNMYGCIPHCTKNCGSESKITIYGKELTRYCCATLDKRGLWVVNPDEDKIKSIKKLLDVERQARMNV